MQEKYKRIRREEITDTGALLLIGVMIKQALIDLFTEPITLDQVPSKVKNKYEFMRDRNSQIEYNKMSARNFFKGDLFKATGLNYQYLIENAENIINI